MLKQPDVALTFDDILLVPNYADFLPEDISTKTRLSRNIDLNAPIISSAMDTVTEAQMAIAIAQLGGLGIIHMCMPPALQAKHVRLVKNFENGIVRYPKTIGPLASVEEVVAITHAQGFSGLPVVEGEQLVGIITNRDIRFANHTKEQVKDLMTPKDRLITVKEGASREMLTALFHRHRIEKICVVNDDFHLKGLITVKDIMKETRHPLASKDQSGQLLVGAAVSTGDDTPERVAALVEAGVDVVVVDTAHGHSKKVMDCVKWVKAHYPSLEVIGGNVATSDGALALVKAGADAVKVGMGPGSICTTRIVAGIGVPQVTAIARVSQALKKYDVPVIADGGIRFSGDLCKAIAVGAHTVMLGSLLAGTEESPGDVVLYKGRSYKAYRGMGSVGAMNKRFGSGERYRQGGDSIKENSYVPEGIEGRVAHKGPLAGVFHQLVGGLRSCMGYTGCSSIEKLRTESQYVQITNAGMRESHVHDVVITKEAPNYSVGAVD